MSKKSSSRLKVTANAFCHNEGRTEAFTSSGPKNKDFGVNIPPPCAPQMDYFGQRTYPRAF